MAAGCGGQRAAPAGPDVPTVVQDDAELLHRSDARTAATLDDLVSLGVDWVRVTAGWSVVAPPGGPPAAPADPGAYPPGAWSRLDRLARLARERGLRLAIDVAFWAPAWAVAEPLPGSERQRRGIDPAAFGAFAEAVARRYPDAVAFTVWNEPNHPVFLLPQWERRDGRWHPAAADAYRAMLREAVPRIRRAAPGALVLIGATSSIGTSRGSAEGDRMSPLAFLRALACVDAGGRPLTRGACRGFAPLPGDGWSHHPYTLDLRPHERDPDPGTARLGDLGRLTGALDALHAAGRTEERLPVYLTELGFQTRPPDPTAPWTPGEQARNLVAAERVALAQPRVRSVSQFLVRDLPERPGDDARTRWADYQSGLRYADGRAKPAHAAFRLPLAVVARSGARLRVWGRIRPGAGVRRGRLERRTAAGWEEAAAVQTDPRGVFEVTVDAAGARALRLLAAGSTGLAVPVPGRDPGAFARRP